MEASQATKTGFGELFNLHWHDCSNSKHFLILIDTLWREYINTHTHTHTHISNCKYVSWPHGIKQDTVPASVFVVSNSNISMPWYSTRDITWCKKRHCMCLPFSITSIIRHPYSKWMASEPEKEVPIFQRPSQCQVLLPDLLASHILLMWHYILHNICFPVKNLLKTEFKFLTR
jgi:hypothetical protein